MSSPLNQCLQNSHDSFEYYLQCVKDQVDMLTETRKLRLKSEREKWSVGKIRTEFGRHNQARDALIAKTDQAREQLFETNQQLVEASHHLLLA